MCPLEFAFQWNYMTIRLDNVFVLSEYSLDGADVIFSTKTWNPNARPNGRLLEINIDNMSFEFAF